jgi:hypothetical protein
MMEINLELTDISIEKILEYLPYFQEGENFEEKIDDNFSTYSEKVNEFIEYLYETNFIVIFEWTEWKDGKKIINDKNLIKKSDLLTLRMLMTMIIRSDRFNDGILLECIKNQTVRTILERLSEIKK